MQPSGEDGEQTELARLRRASGLTQEELAERSGLSERSIRKLEGGHVQRPRAHTLDVLADALRLDPPARAALLTHYRGGPARPGGPDQLPPRPTAFVGRSGELAAVIDALTADAPGPVLITGLGGIGKSALAAESCAAVRAAFPDGRLHAGFGTHRAVEDVLAELIRSLAGPGRALPGTATELAARWRDAVAGRQVLVLVEDALTEEQVRPLLVDGSSRVLVTSRSPLAGLDAALRLRLAPVDAADSAAIVTAASGIDLPPTELAVMVDACAGMPLALRLLAARVTLAPGTAPGVIAGRLAERPDDDTAVMDELSAGDRSVRRSITGSVDLLPDAARTTLERLAELDVPSVPDWLADLVGEGGPRVVEDLVASGLLEAEPGPRYRLHELVRACVREQGSAAFGPNLEACVAWLVQLLGDAVPPTMRRPVPHILWPPRPAALDETLAARTLGDPTTWFETEWRTAVGLADAARTNGRPRLAGAVLAALRAPMTRTGRLRELLALAERCVADPTPDPLARACAQLAAASVQIEFGRDELAGALLTECLPELDTVDACTSGEAWYESGWVHHHLGEHDDARAAYRLAITRHRSIGNLYGELGPVLGLLDLESGGGRESAVAARARELSELIDDYRVRVKTQNTLVIAGHAGTDAAEQALALALEHRDRGLALRCLIVVATARRRDGDPRAAEDSARRAARLARELDRPGDLADALTELGHARRERGSSPQQAWTDALELREALGQHTVADDLRALLGAPARVPS